MRLDSLTGLRWWAAFAVFAHHMTNFAPLPIHAALNYGSYGVTFFFVLSGFVLTWSARATTRATTFWWRRLARIYPSHFVALLLAIPVFYSFTPDAEQPWVHAIDFSVLALSFVLLQGWSRDPSVLFSGNPAAWTLTCEAFFYSLHPVFNRTFRALRVKGGLLVALGALAFAFLYKAALIVWPDSALGALPWPLVRLTEFVIGIGLAKAMLAGWRLRFVPVACYGLTSILIAFFVISPRLLPGSPVTAIVQTISNELVIVVCTLLVASVATSDINGRASLLRSRPIVMLGEWSYAFYLLHATIVYTALSVFGKQSIGWANLLWYLIVLLLSVLAAAALHFAIERPFERTLRKWWDSRALRKSRGARYPVTDSNTHSASSRAEPTPNPASFT